MATSLLAAFTAFLQELASVIHVLAPDDELVRAAWHAIGRPRSQVRLSARAFDTRAPQQRAEEFGFRLGPNDFDDHQFVHAATLRAREPSPPQALRARLGATRGGSFGCLGYTGGHGASSSPAAMSRSYSSRRGSSDWGTSLIVAQGSSRLGAVAIVSSSGSTSGNSSQLSGVDTCAPGRGRADQAPKTVLCGAFWL